MKIKSYLVDKIYLIFIGILSSFIIYAFLHTTGTNQTLIYVILSIYWFTIVISLIVEYLKRHYFYSKLNDLLTTLEPKYLICELLEEPDFIDGKLLHDSLRKTNKSMNDAISLYKNNLIDYKEYIELWVHEIKTPLAASKLIIQNNPSIVNKSIEEEIEKVERFVDQALYYARSNTLEKDYIIKKFTLLPVVSKVVKKNSRSFIYKQIKIQLNNLDVEVYSDSKWIEFILEQILINALKYTPEQSGVISISAFDEKNKVILDIKDNGIGMYSEDVPRVFDKGFTGRNGREYEKATGIGLYLCKKLCLKLNLNIFCSSKLNEGTCIRIIFPKNEVL